VNTVKTILHLAALAAALLASCVCKGKDSSFECVGQVAQISEWRPRKISILKPQEDGRHYDLSSFWDEDPDSHPRVKNGDIVRIRAERAKPRKQMTPDMPDKLVNIIKEIEVTGRGDFPPGEPTTAVDAVSGRRLLEFVRVKGTVSAVAYDESDPTWIHFTLRTPSGNAHAAVPKTEHTLDDLLALTDAEVEVRALVVAQVRWTRFTGSFLLPIGYDSIRTVKPAPAVAPDFADDPHDVIAFSRREANGDYVHKVRMTGLLLTETKSHVFMAIPNGMIVKMALQTKTARPEFGTMVSASGYVSYDFGGLMLHDAVLEPAPDAPKMPLPEVEKTTIWRAYVPSRNISSFTRRMISFTGRLANDPDLTYSTGMLWLQGEGGVTDIDTYAYKFDKRKNKLGLVMRITGVCDPVLETDSEKASAPQFKGITIALLPGDGIHIEKPLSIWSAMNLAVVTIALLFIIALISAACVIQKILYDKRGRLLFAERVAHVRAQTKTEERTRLATELHDAVSQTLTGVALQVDSANIVNRGENPALTKCLATARQLLASCRRELRDCLWDLRSRTFDEKDMTEAVSRAIAPHAGSVKTAVRFNVPRSILSESKVHCILSIVRELVVNAIKHGKATNIWIAGECSEGHISFSVRDNGCGFDVASAPGPSDGHFGLKGIGERIRAAKGTLEVESSPGKGTKATIKLPEAD
jgi:signal transduction histidine kinase